jgi:hypothetical protein
MFLKLIELFLFLLIFNFMYNLCLIFNLENYLFFKLYINIIELNFLKLKNFYQFFESLVLKFFSAHFFSFGKVGMWELNSNFK